jgi:heme A synthase
VVFVLTQVTLGAFVIWSGLQPFVNTAHVVNGALVLATSLVLTLRSRRIAFAVDGATPQPVRNASEPGNLLAGSEFGRTRA